MFDIQDPLPIYLRYQRRGSEHCQIFKILIVFLQFISFKVEKQFQLYYAQNFILIYHALDALPKIDPVVISMLIVFQWHVRNSKESILWKRVFAWSLHNSIRTADRQSTDELVMTSRTQMIGCISSSIRIRGTPVKKAFASASVLLNLDVCSSLLNQVLVRVFVNIFVGSERMSFMAQGFRCFDSRSLNRLFGKIFIHFRWETGSVISRKSTFPSRHIWSWLFHLFFSSWVCPKKKNKKAPGLSSSSSVVFS